jgi:hypothetical protein
VDRVAVDPARVDTGDHPGLVPALLDRVDARCSVYGRSRVSVTLSDVDVVMLSCVGKRDDREIAVQQLLDELCVKLGFCLPPDTQRRLRESPPLDVDSFTDAVFEAEGLDPVLDGRLRGQVRERVDRQMRSWATD